MYLPYRTRREINIIFIDIILIYIQTCPLMKKTIFLYGYRSHFKHVLSWRDRTCQEINIIFIDIIIIYIQTCPLMKKTIFLYEYRSHFKHVVSWRLLYSFACKI